MNRHAPAADDPVLAPEALERLSSELQELRRRLLAGEARLGDALEAVHPQNLPSARNLVHYLALRRHDLRRLQLRLARAGLSSLGRSEPHVLVTLDRVLAMLALARGLPAPDAPPPAVGFRQGERILTANTRRLLGARPARRTVRIILTLSPEVAEDPRHAYDLVAAGMDCARINCARDDASVWKAMAENVIAARRAHGRDCPILVDLGGTKLRTGPIAGGAKRLLLAVGDRLDLVREEAGFPTRDGSLPRIACSPPEILREVQPGQPIWFDDGGIGGVVEERTDAGLRVRVTHAKPAGSKLRPDRGINLPETELSLSAPTEEDLRDLADVVAFADAIEQSFVQRPEDVLRLQEALHGQGADHIGVVLKIETRRGFENLPHLLLVAMRSRCYGVMIARGDLAVEVGFERMAELQEEILWIAEAAHAPTIWATEVLDRLAKQRMLSRAEITDAAMSARAEAVMLNKGPFVVEAIRTLDDILARMRTHQMKKRSLYRPLRVSGSLWT